MHRHVTDVSIVKLCAAVSAARAISNAMSYESTRLACVFCGLLLLLEVFVPNDKLDMGAMRAHAYRRVVKQVDVCAA